MTDDRMNEIKSQVAERYKVFDAQRKVLHAQYDRAKTPKAKLRILAKAIRHHHSYMAHTLMGGWYVESLLNFADAIDDNCEDL
jgi:hypothetical protein